jgi:hypothetical protein
MGAFTGLQPLGTLNVALSNYAKAYRNNAFVSELIAPRVDVARQSFQYVIFDRANQRNDRDVLRAPGARPQTVRRTYSSDTYMCKSHALAASVPFEEEQYALGLGFSAKQNATKLLIDRINLAREVYVASLARDNTKFTNYSDLSVGGSVYPWDDYQVGHSHPIVDVDNAKDLIKQSGVLANAFIISTPVYKNLRNHPDIIDRFKYTTPGAIGLAELSQVFGVPVTEAAAIVLDKSNVGSWIWGGDAVLTYTQPAPTMDDVSAMKTFNWAAAPMTAGGYGVLEFPDPYLDAKTDWESVDWYWDTKVTAAETAYLFKNTVTVPAFGAIAAPTVG